MESFMRERIAYVRKRQWRGSAHNPSPGERVPPVRTLGAGVECGRK